LGSTGTAVGVCREVGATPWPFGGSGVGLPFSSVLQFTEMHLEIWQELRTETHAELKEGVVLSKSNRYS